MKNTGELKFFLSDLMISVEAFTTGDFRSIDIAQNPDKDEQESDYDETQEDFS